MEATPAASPACTVNGVNVSRSRANDAACSSAPKPSSGPARSKPATRCSPATASSTTSGLGGVCRSDVTS